MRIHRLIRIATITGLIIVATGAAREAVAQCWSEQINGHLETYCQTCGQTACCWSHWHDDTLISSGCDPRET